MTTVKTCFVALATAIVKSARNGVPHLSNDKTFGLGEQFKGITVLKPWRTILRRLFCSLGEQHPSSPFCSLGEQSWGDCFAVLANSLESPLRTGYPTCQNDKINVDNWGCPLRSDVNKKGTFIVSLRIDKFGLGSKTFKNTSKLKQPSQNYI